MTFGPDFPIDEGDVLDSGVEDVPRVDGSSPKRNQPTPEQEAEMDRFWAETKNPKVMAPTFTVRRDAT